MHLELADKVRAAERTPRCTAERTTQPHNLLVSASNYT